MKSYVALLCAFLALATATKVDYTGHMVIRVFPETKEQLEFLRDWQTTSSIDFWSLPSRLNEFTDIHVSRLLYNHIAKIFKDMNMNHSIHIANTSYLGKKESRYNIALQKVFFAGGKAINVMAYLADLAATNPLASTKVEGLTNEGREIVHTVKKSPGFW